MFRKKILPLLITGLSPLAANADISLIAIGQVPGHYEDFALTTKAALENGVPGNKLGGVGSGLAYAGGNTFLALPDRGPNAQEYNTTIDNTTSYIPRFHTFSLSLAPSEAGAALPFVLSPFLTGTTLLSSSTPLVYAADGAPEPNHFASYYFSGRSDNFSSTANSTHKKNARLDPEGIRVSNDGRYVYISDEYGPYVHQFSRLTGKRLASFTLPEKFAVSSPQATEMAELAANSSGRVTNKGMEGLAISPDGSTLYGAMQSPLLQDGGTKAPYTRIVRINLKTGQISEYAYELSNIGTASKPKYGTISEIVAINDHEFLVDERDGKGLGDGSTAVYKRLYHIDLSGAAEVSALVGADQLAGKAPSKTLFLDLVSALNNAGLSSDLIPAKIEGVTFGPDVSVNGETRHTLFIANDNDFTASVDGVNNPNQFFVFAFEASDLPGYQPQQFRR